MARKKDSPKGRVVISPKIQFTDDDICLLLFGKNINDLAQDIRNNKDGKYNHLYVKERI